MVKDITPLPGARARQTGVPSGQYPNEKHLTPDKGYEARKTGAPVKAYPDESQLKPRQGYQAKMAKAGDAKTPDTPSPNLVQPKATRPTPRPEQLSFPGVSVPAGKPRK